MRFQCFFFERPRFCDSSFLIQTRIPTDCAADASVGPCQWQICGEAASWNVIVIVVRNSAFEEQDDFEGAQLSGTPIGVSVLSTELCL